MTPNDLQNDAARRVYEAADRLRRDEAADRPGYFSSVYAGSGHCPDQDASTLAGAWLAEHPEDDHLPVDADWLLAAGGEKVKDIRKPFDDDGKYGTWPVVEYGPFVWYTNLWTGHADGTYTATYFLKYGGACLGASPELTRGQFRHLCLGLGVENPT